MHAIIGVGQVGSAFKALYDERDETALLVDPRLGFNDSPLSSDVVHVCTGADGVSGWVAGLKPGALILVHATVPVGTCRKLALGGKRVVHAPVRGRHPDLTESLYLFQMALGTTVEADADSARAALARIGISSTWVGNWETSELSKLLCTTRLGLDVLWMRHCYDLAAEVGADPSMVYGWWTRTYNAGYRALHDGHFCRCILEPTPGPIGGHCVLPNARMLAPKSEYAGMVVDGGSSPWEPTLVVSGAEVSV